jgi:hypothetical protein
MVRFSMPAGCATMVAILAIQAAQAAERCGGTDAAKPECSTENAVNIRIISGETVLSATLADNPSAKDFASLLPLTLDLKDYADTEKVGDLPKKLSTAGAPAGSDPDVGDVAYYAPWGNLAIFYKDFGYSKGLIKLGRIDSGVDALRKTKSLTVRIELLND